MTVRLVAFHYAKPLFEEEMAVRMRTACAVMETAEGCLGVDCWRDTETGAIVAVGTWESEQARARSFAAVRAAALDFDHDDREYLPRKVFRLEPVAAGGPPAPAAAPAPGP